MHRPSYIMRFTTLLMLALGWLGCDKEGFISSPDALLQIGVDTLRFDTVFTSTGSVTRQFTLVNENNQKLRIDRIRLFGGNSSAFALNINGQPLPDAQGLELAAQDSLYIFVRVTINPNAANQPFVVRDSIEIIFNGNNRMVQLQAYGQNARFINGGTLSGTTVWDANLPYVILKPLTVAAGATLRIEKGSRIYCNANAPLIVNGRLQCLGEAGETDRIRFRSDRLDAPNSDFPGGWPGIIFNDGSIGNLLRYTQISNAFQAILCAGQPAAVPAKLIMEQCIIENAYDIGLFAFNSSVIARNCKITQCGNDGQAGTGGSNVILTGGGQYNFEHCTLVTYANFYQNHRQPVLYAGNSFNGVTQPMHTRFTNCIVWGEGGLPENEILINRVAGPAFTFLLQNVLYKSKDALQNVVEQQVIRNQDPLFDSINTNLRRYNFRLRTGSPAINAGQTSILLTDLDGNPRTVGTQPDLGAYEMR